MRRRDIVAALAVLALGAGAVVGASGLAMGGVHNPGPGFFPWWLGLFLVLLGAVLLVQAVRAPLGAVGEGGRPLRVFALLAALAGYVAVLDPIGYPLATLLLVLFMLLGLERHRWPLALAVGVLAAGGSYVLFAVWLGVPLPPGPLAP